MIAIFSKAKSLSQSTVAVELPFMNPWPKKPLCFIQLKQAAMHTGLCQDISGN